MVDITVKSYFQLDQQQITVSTDAVQFIEPFSAFEQRIVVGLGDKQDSLLRLFLQETNFVHALLNRAHEFGISLPRDLLR